MTGEGHLQPAFRVFSDDPSSLALSLAPVQLGPSLVHENSPESHPSFPV